MNPDMKLWVESSFNIAYLITVWALVIAMLYRKSKLLHADFPLLKLFILAYALLGFGDFFHVGTRVIAYAMGGIEATATILNIKFSIIGPGRFFTAVTVSLFYVVMLLIWRKRFNREFGWFGTLLLVIATVRVLFLFLPQNEWGTSGQPQPFYLLRNSMLFIQGIGVAYLILRDAFARSDKTFKWIGGLIVFSYICYLPVMLFLRVNPMLGMLMIPKTMAYVAIAFTAYFSLFRED
jgi:hypothetical protein